MCLVKVYDSLDSTIDVISGANKTFPLGLYLDCFSLQPVGIRIILDNSSGKVLEIRRYHSGSGLWIPCGRCKRKIWLND